MKIIFFLDQNVLECRKNGPFIFSFVNKMWGKCQSYRLTSKEEINDVPNKESGFYIFYLDSGLIQYPIYIGITGRNFRKRFQEHLVDGVIDKWCNGQFPINDPPIRLPLKAILVPIGYNMQAKLMESVFLKAFDFCLNSQENYVVRTELDVGTIFRPEDSKENFDIIFNNIMQEIKDVYESYIAQ